MDGRWSTWGEWAECSVTCADGVSLRLRNCTVPSPKYGGQSCPGDSQDTRPCTLPPCPGEWMNDDDDDHGNDNEIYDDDDDDAIVTSITFNTSGRHVVELERLVILQRDLWGRWSDEGQILRGAQVRGVVLQRFKR